MALGSLRELGDWQLENDEEDIIGWPVIDDNGAQHGTIVDLIVDTDRQHAVEIVTDRGERFQTDRVDIGEKVVTVHGEGKSGVSVMTGIDAVDESRFGTHLPGSLGVGAVDESRMRPRICRRGGAG